MSEIKYKEIDRQLKRDIPSPAYIDECESLNESHTNLLNENEQLRQELAQLKEELKRQEIAWELFQVDPHQWSGRPCGTCDVVSASIGRKIGCALYRETQAKRKCGV